MKRVVSWLTIVGIVYAMSSVLTLHASEINGLTCSGKVSCSRFSKSCSTKSLNQATTNHSAVSMPTASSDDIHWHEYSPDMFDQAKKEHLLIVLYVKSMQCHWSQQMEQVTFKDPSIIKLIDKNYLPAYIDFDQNNSAAMQYQVLNVPTVLILDHNNETIKSLSGYITPDEMKQYIYDISQTYHQEINKNDK